jgi:reactive intermediate/imine deaminase
MRVLRQHWPKTLMDTAWVILDFMHSKRLISSGSSFEAVAGYSRAVVENGLVHVSGTTGFDYATMTISDDAVAQTHQCFANISAALTQAGASLDDVVRVHYLLTDAALFNTLAPVFGQYFKQARPAATAMIVGLVDPRMKIEIEVTARLP